MIEDKLTVYVTNADLTEDYMSRECLVRTNRSNCPVGEAMNRALQVDDGFAISDRYVSYVTGSTFMLPEVAREFIRRYDANLQVWPFRFSIRHKDVNQYTREGQKL